MNTTNILLNLFIKERNEALFSLDETKIREYGVKYQVPFPDNPVTFWGGVYKAICNITEAPEELKATARKWLSEHGMSEVIA